MIINHKFWWKRAPYGVYRNLLNYASYRATHSILGNILVPIPDTSEIVSIEFERVIYKLFNKNN